MKIKIHIKDGSCSSKRVEMDTGASVSKEELCAIGRVCDALHSPNARREWARSFARQVALAVKEA